MIGYSTPKYWTIKPAPDRDLSVTDRELWWWWEHFGEDAKWPEGTRPVLPISKIGVRKDVEHYATYFRREFDYDFVQLTREGFSPESIAFLFFTNHWNYNHRSYGALHLVLQSYRNAVAPVWKLNWIWVHPFARHQGTMREIWGPLTRVFGPLDVEPPFSSSIRRFLDEIDWLHPTQVMGTEPLPEFKRNQKRG